MRAGHPLPVAISMVAKEMPDPIGSEFGLVADEATYGLELGEALRNMRMRSGQSDLAFLVVAVSIQSKTGGNLSEILSNLSAMVRERTKMRRKVHSLSSEGRVSAIVLSLMPVAIWGIVSTVSPNYYGDIGDHPLVMKAFYLSLTIWAVGAFVLYRMVNFKF
jgi:tight adherence protein B